MDIMTGLSAISETLHITKELRKIDHKVDVAELKLRLADLVDGLLEAKEALQDAKEREAELRNTIKELESKLEESPKYTDRNGLMFELDEEGKEIGEPYCHYCYVKEEKFFRLRRRDYATEYYCENCLKGAGAELPSGIITGDNDYDPYRY